MNLTLSTMCPPVKAIQKNWTAHRRSAVCRNLFGPVNHRLTEKFLTKELDEVLASCKKDWDFDFSCGVPLNGGRFAWVPTTFGSGIDESGPSGMKLRPGSCRDLPVAGSKQETDKPNLMRSRTKRIKMAASKTDMMSPCKSYRQPSIKDYLPIRKRATKLKKPIVFTPSSRKNRRSDLCRRLRPSRFQLRSVQRRNEAL